MRKLLLACFVLFMHTVHALPVGNPTDPSIFRYEGTECDCSWFGCGLGFYGDYVFNRYLETTRGRDVDTVKLFTNAAYLVVNFQERLDVFATLGATRISLNTSFCRF